MTNFRKVLSVFMSMCFFLVLAMMPGQFFFQENVYRQLPLYSFLENRALAVPFEEDEETVLLLAEKNGEYIGRKLLEEQMMEELEAENKRTDKKEKRAVEVSRVSALPHPVIDLSPERLADSDYLLNQFFVEDSAVNVRSGLLDAARFLDRNLTMERDSTVPQILIYHTHSTEAFADSREGKESDTVVGVGNYLEKLLTEKYGYQVVHIKNAFDMAGGELDRSAAYDYAREYLEDFLKKNPRIEVIIDLHRDGVPEERHLVTEIQGKNTAQVMFYNGISCTKKQGTVEYLPNPYIEDNLAFSFQMEYKAAQYYPEFYRCIYLAGYRYNLHMRPKSMLLEVGAQNNTVREAKNAMEPFAELLDMVLQGK